MATKEKLEIKSEGDFQFVEEGEGEPIILLHGLFGALSNWDAVVHQFSMNYKVLIPLLPIYELPVRQAGLEKLVDYISDFIEMKGLTGLTVMGNSLGGHLALIYALRHPDRVKRMVLTGSSGLFENSMGGTFPKRGSYEYIKERVQYTFYYPETISEDYINDVFEITRSIPKCMRIVAIAKSAQRHNMAEEITKINVPTLLVWGLNDTITPPMVAHDFNRLIPNTYLHFIDKCSHAPMMEHPGKFNKILDNFLQKTS